LRRPANFALHAVNAEALSSLVAAFSAASAHSSKSAGARLHHCACARERCNTALAAPIAAISMATLRDAITNDFPKIPETQFTRIVAIIDRLVTPEIAAFFSCMTCKYLPGA
jgi:hypothetical protein